MFVTYNRVVLESIKMWKVKIKNVKRETRMFNEKKENVNIKSRKLKNFQQWTVNWRTFKDLLPGSILMVLYSSLEILNNNSNK